MNMSQPPTQIECSFVKKEKVVTTVITYPKTTHFSLPGIEFTIMNFNIITFYSSDLEKLFCGLKKIQKLCFLVQTNVL